MSSDNGIYILQLNDQARVCHAQAMDNIYWSFVDFAMGRDIVPTRIVERFVRAEELTLESSRIYAFKLEEEIMNSEFPLLEYGISTIRINKTWSDLVKEAKVLALIEKASIEATGRIEFWKYDLGSLDSILSLSIE